MPPGEEMFKYHGYSGPRPSQSSTDTQGGTEVVGHKTLQGEDGRLYHEPLRRHEAEALLAHVEAEQGRREALMPDEQAARKLFFDAWLRLRDFGWREACYCPKDGRTFDVIEAGSSGVHACSYEGEWPTGRYWVHGEDDLYPSHPTLFRERSEDET